MIVYLVTNLINGKRYVGQTSQSLQRRWNQHQTHEGCVALRSAIDKYGVQNFSIEALYLNLTKQLADEFESEYIKRYKTKSPNGYNLTDGGEGIVNPSEETRQKMAKAQIGKKQSEQTKLKRVEKLKGQKRTEETKKRLSLSQMGNQNCLGRMESEETRKKKSIANIGNKNSVGAVRTPEYLKALSDRFKGRIFSEETKRKMSEAASSRVVSQETKDKHRDSAKRLGLRPPVLSREELAEAGRISGHKRYHVARNIKNPECKLCQGTQ